MLIESFQGEKYCHKQFLRINTNVIHSDQTRSICLSTASYLPWENTRMLRILKSYAFNDTWVFQHIEWMRPLSFRFNILSFRHCLFVHFSSINDRMWQKSLFVNRMNHKIIISVFMIAAKWVLSSRWFACLTWYFVTDRWNNDQMLMWTSWICHFWQNAEFRYLYIQFGWSLWKIKFGSSHFLALISQFHLIPESEQVFQDICDLISSIILVSFFHSCSIVIKVLAKLDSLECEKRWSHTKTYTHIVITTANPLQAHSWQHEKKAIFQLKEGIKRQQHQLNEWEKIQNIRERENKIDNKLRNQCNEFNRLVFSLNVIEIRIPFSFAFQKNAEIEFERLMNIIGIKFLCTVMRKRKSNE